jgi:hypothetical protein
MMRCLSKGPATMPRREGGATSGRLIVQKLAAHLAYLLNSGEASAALEPGELYRKLLRTLSGGSDGRGEGNPYVETLVAIHLLGPDISADQAAAFYFERVLNRPLFLARRVQYHKAHELLLVLCRRGLDDRWTAADLVRSTAPIGRAEGCGLPTDFEDVGERMDYVRRGRNGEISAGNPAASTRAEFGPIYLKLDAAGFEVAEELSLWEAITCAPRSLRVLSPPEFDAFCSLIIKALETANAHYGALVTLRLSPRDWAEELSVNTAKKLSAFLSEVRALAPSLQMGADAIEVWQKAWLRRQVPGYASARALWSSALGHALRGSGVLARSARSELEDADESEGEPTTDPSAFLNILRQFRGEGVLDAYDAWLVRQLANKKKLAQLAKSPRTLFKFGRQEIPDSYIEQLLDRVRRHRFE